MNTEIMYNTFPSPYWDWRVAVDLFLGGAGVGALLFAVGIDEWFRGKYRRICQTGATLAPILVGAGLLVLLMKMGRPFHLFNSYANFNPHSPLWWGGVFQPLLVLGSIVYAAMWYRSPSERPSLRTWLGRLLTPIGVIVGAYHGLVLAINVSRPLWNTGPTVVAAVLGFASTGIACVMLVHLLRMKVAGRLADAEHVGQFLDNMRIVRNTLVAVLVLQLGTFFLWWLSLEFGSLRDQQAIELANERYGPMFWYLGIGAGLVLPLALGALAAARGRTRRRRFELTMIFVTSALVLVGGFFFRLAVVLAGQLDLPVRTIT